MKTLSIKLFLDDIRVPRDCIGYMYTRIGKDNLLYTDPEWFVVRNFKEFVEAVQECHNEDIEITHVSFDHDLADEHYDPIMMVNDDEYHLLAETFKERTGYDCAVFLKEMYERQGKKLPQIMIHTMNPAGLKRIADLFKQ